jgi:hypothetical protein
MAWHRLPPKQTRRATIKIISEPAYTVWRVSTTDEIDKSFLLDLLFLSDRVAKSRAEYVISAAQLTVALHWRYPCAVFRDDAAAIG